MQYRLGVMDDLDGTCLLVRDAIAMMESQGIQQWDGVYPGREVFETDIRKRNLYLGMENAEIVAVYVLNRECEAEYHKCNWKCPDDTSCVVHRLCVSPKHQGKGVAKNILAHIEEQLLQMGYQSVRLDVFTENPIAVRLYKGCGYRERGYADWRKGRFLLMEKDITISASEIVFETGR